MTVSFKVTTLKKKKNEVTTLVLSREVVRVG